MGKRSRSRKLAGLPYTPGQVNRWIDSVVHPLAKENPAFWMVDFALHAMVERNPGESLRKFVHYDLRPLLEGLDKLLKKQS